MNELEQLTEGISKILSWYSSSNSRDGDLLTSAKQKLCGYSFRFSVIVGDTLDSYRRAYSHRKSETAKKVMEYVKDGDAQFKATMKSEIDVKDMRLVESSYESMYRRVKSQFDIMRDTISSMQQDISTLKAERNESKSI